MLTLAYNSRPQKSTGVVPLEFVTPKQGFSEYRFFAQIRYNRLSMSGA